jgi:hypothetical protein
MLHISTRNTFKQNDSKASGSGTMVEHFTTDHDIKGSNPIGHCLAQEGNASEKVKNTIKWN